MASTIEDALAAGIVFSQAPVELDSLTVPTPLSFSPPHRAGKCEQNALTPESYCKSQNSLLSCFTDHFPQLCGEISALKFYKQVSFGKI